MVADGRVEFWWGTMGSGKSTLALQRHYNLVAVGQPAVLWTFGDRSGGGMMTSRIGIEAPAVPVAAATDLVGPLGDVAEQPRAALIVDEAQFATPAQVDAMAAWADLHGRVVACYGLLTDFTGHLFPGAARLLEVADVHHRLQLHALCWCGRAATHNARLVDGAFTREGPTVAIGDTSGRSVTGRDGDASSDGEVTYVPLCRPHHRDGTTGPT